MNRSTIEEQVANLPPRLTAAQHNAFPNGRYDGVAAAIPEILQSPAPAPAVVLMPDEAMDLNFCEQRIERGLETFLEVGLALTLIRDKRLYRATHATFEDYCNARWEINASRARQLCAAAQIVQGLKSKVQSAEEVLPTSERQVRPLMSLPAEQQQAVWREAVATAPDGKVTSKHVEAVANKITGRTSPRPSPQRGEGGKVIDAGTKIEQVKAAAARAIADARELIDLSGTADSAAASDLVVALEILETYGDHLTHVGKLQEARA